MYRVLKTAGALGLALFVVQSAGSAASASSKAPQPVASRLIVKFRAGPQKRTSPQETTQRLAALSLYTGMNMHIARSLSGGAQLVSIKHPMTPAQLTAISNRLASLPGVEYAEPDVRLYPVLVPNDPGFALQYYLRAATREPAAINAPAAWNMTTGSAATVVAIIDSGIRPEHIDIKGRLLPGYDFVSADPGSSFSRANDGNGRDPNPADPGDGVAAGACGANNPPFPMNSLWHGTRVASLIGAVTNEGQGIAGIDWNARLLPVRTLGRCGVGYVTDFIDALRWAAGLPVPGVPDNPNPAQIINLSVGGPHTCLASEQAAIDDVIAAGALVVAAAGNRFTNALRDNPANCRGVLSIAATDRNGGLANFSNFGAVVGLSAPGVNILTAANRGIRAPLPNGSIHSSISGTSFSSPMAAGVAALMLSINPNLTPQQLIGTLRANARAFPQTGSGTHCDNRLCGAGLIDAFAAVRAVMMGRITAATDGGNGLRAAFAAAMPLSPGVPRRGLLSRPFQFDVYAIRLPSGGALSVSTRGPTDTYGYLFNSSGRLLSQNDDINRPANLNFGMDANLPPGVYYVAVEGLLWNTIGPYTLTARLAAPSAGR
jgi:serine protease